MTRRKGGGRRLAVALGSLVLVALAPGAIVPAGAVFRGLNGAIVYDADGDLYSVQPDGSGLLQLTSGGAWDEMATWSPDGKKLLFDSDRRSKPPVWVNSIWMMDADGKNLKRLTRSDGWDYGAAWSPDGKRIVFNSDRRGRWGLYVKRIRGGPARRITSINFDAFEADWAPNGRWISFSSDTRGSDWEVYKIRPSGRDLTQVTHNGVDDYDAGWSSDGKQIVFATDRNSPDPSQCFYVPGELIYPTDCNVDIYLMSATGKDQRQVTSGPANDFYPVLSPDGEFVTFVSDELDQYWDVHVSRIDGSGRSDLSLSPQVFDFAPDWQALREKR